MDDGTRSLEARRRRQRTSPLMERPDRVAMWAFFLAVAVMIAAAASAHAGSGGVGSTGSGGSGGVGGGSGSAATPSSHYAKAWDSFATADRRWAHRVSECESGGDPKAIGGGGRYRGAFQFTRPTWSAAPKSPGGDPIRYPWVTQAVVAVLLKHRVGTSPWPVCGKPKSPRAVARTARIARAA